MVPLLISPLLSSLKFFPNELNSELNISSTLLNSNILRLQPLSAKSNFNVWPPGFLFNVPEKNCGWFWIKIPLIFRNIPLKI